MNDTMNNDLPYDIAIPAALLKEIIRFILEEITVDRKAALKLRDLRRRLAQLDKPVEKPEGLEPLCPL